MIASNASSAHTRACFRSLAAAAIALLKLSSRLVMDGSIFQRF
jgi:hypothetical protein